MTVAKKKTEPDSVVDAMAEDAVPAEYPEGAPVFHPIRAIRPFSRRAEFKRKMGELEPIKNKLSALSASGVLDPKTAGVTDQARSNAAADLDDMYQLIDELLLMAAVNPEAYQEWAASIEDDQDLTRVFNVYMSRSQPGEASSSTS